MTYIKNERAFNVKSQVCYILQNSSLHINDRQLNLYGHDLHVKQCQLHYVSTTLECSQENK